MKWLVIGNGTQGKKRQKLLGSNCIGVVDPYDSNANFSSIDNVPLNFNIAAICTSHGVKSDYLFKLASLGISCLVEKPFPYLVEAEYKKLESICEENKVFIYTAYNHRFEPGIEKFAEIVAAGNLGEFYFCNMRYGNGTAIDVRRSVWKNRDEGLILDLGSHLVDLAKYIFNRVPEILIVESTYVFEVGTIDYARLKSEKMFFELGYIFWKSDFRIDAFFSKGSVHIEGLQKWGECQVTLRFRTIPSGVPKEKIYTFKGPDLTWAQEHNFVEKLYIDKTIGIFGNPLQMTKLLVEAKSP